MTGKASLWDGLHRDVVFSEEGACLLEDEEKGIRWRRMHERIMTEFGSCRLSVLEIGAGSGSTAALLARLGADVTLLDYSEEALQSAGTLYKQCGLEARFVLADALDMPPEMEGRFDLTLSFGLAEHFAGPDRLNIFSAHLKPLRRNGLAFIGVPNRYNLPYRIHVALLRKLGMWPYGLEIPYSRSEIAALCRRLGVEDYSFFGDSTASSLQFVNPFRVSRKLRKFFHVTQRPWRKRREKGSFLDQYLAYTLILQARKPEVI